MKKIIIIGAGASGVYLSILLKQSLQSKVDVLVLEQNNAPLKKILATGNGRCNLSNREMNIDYYQSDNQTLIKDIITSFDMKQAMDEIGLYCIYQGDLLYPKSEQALSVKTRLMSMAEDLGVTFLYNQEVQSIEQRHQSLIQTSDQSYSCDYVIFAMGSEAGKLSGNSSIRYELLKNLHLNVLPSMPSLVQMKTKPVLKQLKGVRVKGIFSLLENNRCIHKEKGEMLFTDYGVSGIAIMQLSSFYKENHSYDIAIDFFDEKDEKKLNEYIELRIKKDYNHLYDGLLHSKLASYLESLPKQNVQDVVKNLKDFRLHVTGLQSFETAQVMKGGLSLNEVDSTLQIKKYPHMYATGEILNVAGMCGGYNLHFAFSSANHVAKAIEREFHDQNQQCQGVIG